MFCQKKEIKVSHNQRLIGPLIREFQRDSYKIPLAHKIEILKPKKTGESNQRIANRLRIKNCPAIVEPLSSRA